MTPLYQLLLPSSVLEYAMCLWPRDMLRLSASTIESFSYVSHKTYLPRCRFQKFAVDEAFGLEKINAIVHMWRFTMDHPCRLQNSQRFCGSKMPADVTTTGRSTLIRFYADFAQWLFGPRDGYLAKYITST